jgi:hypothetical protein
MKCVRIAVLWTEVRIPRLPQMLTVEPQLWQNVEIEDIDRKTERGTGTIGTMVKCT